MVWSVDCRCPLGLNTSHFVDILTQVNGIVKVDEQSLTYGLHTIIILLLFGKLRYNRILHVLNQNSILTVLKIFCSRICKLK